MPLELVMQEEEFGLTQAEFPAATYPNCYCKMPDAHLTNELSAMSNRYISYDHSAQVTCGTECGVCFHRNECLATNFGSSK
jgi:hypothetical protein